MSDICLRSLTGLPVLTLVTTLKLYMSVHLSLGYVPNLPFIELSLGGCQQQQQQQQQ